MSETEKDHTIAGVHADTGRISVKCHHTGRCHVFKIADLREFLQKDSEYFGKASDEARAKWCRALEDLRSARKKLSNVRKSIARLKSDRTVVALELRKRKLRKNARPLLAAIKKFVRDTQ